MVLRKGKERLQKPCEKCGELFIHRSSNHKLCNKCNPHGTADWIVESTKLSKKIARREKMKKRLSEVAKSKELKGLEGKRKK